MDEVFRLYTLEAGKCINIQNDNNLLVFVLDGELLLSGLGKENTLKLHKSINLLPVTSKILMRSRGKAKFLTMSFDLTSYFSVEYTQRLLLQNKNKENEEVCIDLKDGLIPVLQSVLYYIEDNINQQELFETLRKGVLLILQLYYPEEVIGKLFLPILNVDLTFKQEVMSNCLRVATLNELASLTKYSKSGFIKKFHRCFGISPYKWILEYKVKRILQEVKVSDKQFKEIAEDYGISNLSYFYTFCKKHYGKSPTNLRKDGRIAPKKIKNRIK